VISSGSSIRFRCKQEKGDDAMTTKVVDFCTECGEITDFDYDGEQWVCLNCGSHDSQGQFDDSLPQSYDEE